MAPPCSRSPQQCHDTWRSSSLRGCVWTRAVCVAHNATNVKASMFLSFPDPLLEVLLSLLLHLHLHVCPRTLRQSRCRECRVACQTTDPHSPSRARTATAPGSQSRQFDPPRCCTPTGRRVCSSTHGGSVRDTTLG